MKQLPTWFSILQPNSYISINELKEVLGYKSTAALNKAIKNGELPPPDTQPNHSFHVTSKVKPRYRVSTVLAILEKQQTETHEA